MTRPAEVSAPRLTAGENDRAWHTLDVGQTLAAEEVDAQSGLSPAEAASRAQRYGPNKFTAAKVEPRWRAFLRQYADLMQIVLLAAGILSLYPAQAAGHRNPAALPDGVQRGPRPPAGRQGRRRGRRAAEDDDHQGQGQARRPADPDPRRAARPRRRRGGRGRRHRPGRRQAAESRDSRGGRIRAHRGEPARQQVGGRGPRHRYPARRPHRHGVHEHQRHPGHGRVRRDGDRDGDRGRAHLRDAAERRRPSRPRSPASWRSSPSRSCTSPASPWSYQWR